MSRLASTRSRPAAPWPNSVCCLAIGSPRAALGVDISALSDETCVLIRILLVTAAIFGLHLIWFSALPALHVFYDVVVWHGAEIVDGT